MVMIRILLFRPVISDRQGRVLVVALGLGGGEGGKRARLGSGSGRGQHPMLIPYSMFQCAR